jgi:hypothetical protein
MEAGSHRRAVLGMSEVARVRDRRLRRVSRREPHRTSAQTSRPSCPGCTAFNPRSASRPGGPAGGMPGKVTYYAIADALSSREQPAGVLRRIEHADGQHDEAFGLMVRRM